MRNWGCCCCCDAECFVCWPLTTEAVAAATAAAAAAVFKCFIENNVAELNCCWCGNCEDNGNCDCCCCCCCNRLIKLSVVIVGYDWLIGLEEFDDDDDERNNDDGDGDDDNECGGDDNDNDDDDVDADDNFGCNSSILTKEMFSGKNSKKITEQQNSLKTNENFQIQTKRFSSIENQSNSNYSQLKNIFLVQVS